VGSKVLQSAAVWYERAAANGYSGGAWDLGDLLHANGEKEEARRNYAQAAKVGGADDKLKWGKMLENGFVGEADLIAAAAAYRSASEKGSVRATYHLASLYFLGADGLPRDRDKVRQLFIEAALGGDTDAINIISALGV
jgi:TPR repeat protein